MFGLLKKRRRKRLMETPMSPAWRDILQRNVPLALALPVDRRRQLEGLVQVFVDEKPFEGCRGQKITDDVRVTVAANACLLLLSGRSDFFPHVGSVLIYPASYRVKQTFTDERGFEAEVDEENLGEAWERGSVILSWEDVVLDCRHPDDGFNLVLHEFAHQLDMEDGSANGTPRLPEKMREAWKRVMSAEFARLQALADTLPPDDGEGDGSEPGDWQWEPRPAHSAHESVLDPYGAEDPAEFFAVATEAFFEDARRLREGHGELYGLLAEFYGLDWAGHP